ncbi:hypothetical protein HY501_02270 [Candidatus Woesearchaeota archaeon]|nr:hypothetical protein [Candidatus Woesearchaeota archaeon]
MNKGVILLVLFLLLLYVNVLAFSSLGFKEYLTGHLALSPAVVTKSSAACSNGQNDDRDGLVDLLDPGCSSATDASELSAVQCDNNIDDDRDSLIDFPADCGCSSAGGTSETNIGSCSTESKTTTTSKTSASMTESGETANETVIAPSLPVSKTASSTASISSSEAAAATDQKTSVVDTTAGSPSRVTAGTERTPAPSRSPAAQKTTSTRVPEYSLAPGVTFTVRAKSVLIQTVEADANGQYGSAVISSQRSIADHGIVAIGSRQYSVAIDAGSQTVTLTPVETQQTTQAPSSSRRGVGGFFSNLFGGLF